MTELRIAIVVFVFVCLAWVVLDGAASIISRNQQPRFGLRFSLRTLLIGMALVAVVLGIIALSK